MPGELPGLSVPPLFTVTVLLIVPVPPSVPLEFTVAGETIEPVTASVPAFTVVAPGEVLALSSLGASSLPLLTGVGGPGPVIADPPNESALLSGLETVIVAGPLSVRPVLMALRVLKPPLLPWLLMMKPPLCRPRLPLPVLVSAVLLVGSLIVIECSVTLRS